MDFFDDPQPAAHYDADCFLCGQLRPIGFPACYQHRSRDEWRWLSQWERFYNLGFCLPNVRRIDDERSRRTPSLF